MRLARAVDLTDGKLFEETLYRMLVHCFRAYTLGCLQISSIAASPDLQLILEKKAHWNG